ncbi:hypothetical protein CYLTODRAFT_425074 [Cylindrobasidium torrendii FP15055 ss-10]|uniref:Xylanolytic transcriptional activator regulatory domain-containing protein n=1 Tax=Cylindrobasidium torrendii FP15055 ss-10 TaxID=1314674 RepID=A0A0D7B256_9AGAR|nr:hypothetical protein CYLTODRAFT_425074 [Cylindrobasidium torrendii FP15055 ss-10]
MKCVGAEDGSNKCQRCKRSQVECVFEKHRRGRKPGSKLSEASKMLRRLEKGLINAKRKNTAQDYSQPGPSVYPGGAYHTPTNTHFPSNELPPPHNMSPQYPADGGYPQSAGSSRTIEVDDEDDDREENDEVYPARVIKKENQRNNFLRTILNPEDEHVKVQTRGSESYSPPSRDTASPVNNVTDPIDAGLVTEEDAKILFDAIFIRLNPFINLFDPALHTVQYVRSKSRFLFTVLIACGCRFFKHDAFKQCQRMAQDLAIQAFADQWKCIEVCQAFACLIYWREPDENRTWTYIGYASRMAIELNLNRYVAVPPPHETELQFLERRNRERTYLVLFVHDRSLSTQTGRSWMLPEDDLVRHVHQWHEWNGGPIRPEDVVVAAFTTLRHITAETTEIFHDSRTGSGHSDMKYDVVLRNCNGKLTQWMDQWTKEMQKAGGQTFHFSLLSFFRLYDRLFLNSFGIQYSSSNQTSPSVQAVSACYMSATEALRILSKDFADMSMLRYCQDSVTVMSAYAAVFLLKLLRSSPSLLQLHDGAAREIYSVITATADAYQAASNVSPTSAHAAYHARFLRSLLHNDLFNTPPVRAPQPIKYEEPIDPRLHPMQGHDGQGSLRSPTQNVYPPVGSDSQEAYGQHYNSSPTTSTASAPTHYQQQIHHQHNGMGGNGGMYTAYAPGPVAPPPPPPPSSQQEMDAQYWRNMFLNLGFGGQGDNPNPMAAIMTQPHTAPHYQHHSHSQMQQQQPGGYQLPPYGH